MIAADVGSLREEVVEEKTGFSFKPKDTTGLAQTIERYFSHELYRGLETNRSKIKEFANERYSWSKVGAITENVYRGLLEGRTVRAAEATSR